MADKSADESSFARLQIPLTLVLSPKGRGDLPEGKRARAMVGGPPGESRLRVAPTGRKRGPIYVFTKRTHRFFAGFLTHPTRVQLVRNFGESVFRWVRFPKRTHREGVLRGVEVVLGRFWGDYEGGDE